MKLRKHDIVVYDPITISGDPHHHGDRLPNENDVVMILHIKDYPVLGPYLTYEDKQGWHYISNRDIPYRLVKVLLPNGVISDWFKESSLRPIDD